MGETCFIVVVIQEPVLKTSRNTLLILCTLSHSLATDSYPCPFHPELLKRRLSGTPLAVQWLRLHIPMPGAWVRSLVRELRTLHALRQDKGEKKRHLPVFLNNWKIWFGFSLTLS